VAAGQNLVDFEGPGDHEDQAHLEQLLEEVLDEVAQPVGPHRHARQEAQVFHRGLLLAQNKLHDAHPHQARCEDQEACLVRVDLRLVLLQFGLADRFGQVAGINVDVWVVDLGPDGCGLHPIAEHVESVLLAGVLVVLHEPDAFGDSLSSQFWTDLICEQIYVADWVRRRLLDNEILLL